MVKTELDGFFRLGNLTTFISTEYGSLVYVVVGKLMKVLMRLGWCTIRSCGIAKDLDGGGISYGEIIDNLFKGDLV